MNKQDLTDRIAFIEDSFDRFLKMVDNPQHIIYEAMDYSLRAGGKRLRPILMIECARMCNPNIDINSIMPFAVGMEMIHTYSLIHDDLPAMDNDDLRRGKPTNHKVYGEANAILAGDALLNKAFEIMSTKQISHCYANNGTPCETQPVTRSSSAPCQRGEGHVSGEGIHLNNNEIPQPIPAYEALHAINIISTASGTEGMIGGQIVDIAGCTTIEELEYMYSLKTGAIIKASCEAGATLGGGTYEEVNACVEYAVSLGIAFQIQDDVLDCIGDEAVLGKPIGSDAEQDKVTFVSLLGIDEAKRRYIDYYDQAINHLKIFGEKAGFLIDLTNYLKDRER